MDKLALALPAVANKPLMEDAAVVALNTEAYHLWNYLGLTAAALMVSVALAPPLVALLPAVALHVVELLVAAVLQALVAAGLMAAVAAKNMAAYHSWNSVAAPQLADPLHSIQLH